MNCFIETLSFLSTNLDVNKFSEKSFSTPKENLIIRGKQTNEAPSKYLMWCLANEGKLFDKTTILVTEECIGEKYRIPGLNNRTTYEYYLDEMKSYLCDLAEEFSEIKDILRQKYNGSIDYYIANTFDCVLVPSNPTEKESKSIVESVVFDNESDKEKIRLSLDFTGGSRVASLIALLLVRILEITNAELDKVVYANILTEPFEIVDLSDSYNLLKRVENIAKAKSVGSNQELIKELKIMDLVTEKDVAKAEVLDVKSEKAARNLKKLSEENQKKQENELAELTKNTKGIAKIAFNDGVEQVKASNRASAFKKLIQKNGKDKTSQEIVVDFHEEIFGILWDLDVITFGNNNSKKAPWQLQEIKNAIKANDVYFLKYIKYKDRKKRELVTEECGVIAVVKKWLKNLDSNDICKPMDNMNYYLKIENENEYGKVYRYKREKYLRGGISAERTEDFLRYLDEKSIEVKGDTEEQRFRELVRLQRVYYNCGFPFMCMSANFTNDKDYPEIMNYYLKKTELLMQELQEFYETDKKAYKEKLSELINNDAAIEEYIPYMVEMPLWTVNSKKFPTREEGQAFIKTLCARIEKVRLYRNAIAHKLDNNYSDSARIRTMADEIKGWVAEYDKMFTQKEEEK